MKYHYPPEKLEQLFWAKVNKDGPVAPHMDSQCWIWTGCRNNLGYGKVGIGNYKTRSAHRHALILSGTDIPAGMCALHRCDNPSCVRPDHLYVGTQAQNVADREGRGRTARGEQVANRGELAGNAKLTAGDVRTIRALVASGASHHSVAARFSVGREAVSKIVRRERWAHI